MWSDKYCTSSSNVMTWCSKIVCGILDVTVLESSTIAVRWVMVVSLSVNFRNVLNSGITNDSIQMQSAIKMISYLCVWIVVGTGAVQSHDSHVMVQSMKGVAVFFLASSTVFEFASIFDCKNGKSSGKSVSTTDFAPSSAAVNPTTPHPEPSSKTRSFWSTKMIWRIDSKYRINRSAPSQIWYPVPTLASTGEAGWGGNTCSWCSLIVMVPSGWISSAKYRPWIANKGVGGFSVLLLL